MNGWLARAIGAPGATSFRRYQRIVRDANDQASAASELVDADLAVAARRAKASLRASDGFTPTGEVLAVLREAAERTLGQRPFDEQLLACCALMTGHAVEMDTGEGKTLVGALAAAGLAVRGRRVHVLSVNDYLAQRDAEWMMPLFEILGLSVGWIGQHTKSAQRREIYERDVVYAPVGEVGYDTLRDRFATSEADQTRPAPDVAIVDEADAVMIDEAMSPLVLAGSAPDEAEDFTIADRLVRDLSTGIHFTIDDDFATVSLTDEGLDELEQRLGDVNLYDSAHTAALTRINLALHAHVLVERDVDYLVADDAIKLINTARGRVAHQQRWPDGLHAAVEVKEGLTVSSPGIILDTVTVQDLLKDYATLAGMSGTIIAVAEELSEFYELRSGRVERRLPNRRIDNPQHVFLDDRSRAAAVVAEVRARHERGQPVLVGTQSVAESEHFARVLADSGILTRVLNARNDAEEAAVIARAGEFDAVTISTQMSGRGTDIRLGGPDEADRERVVATGGLTVIEVGRYPSGRLDTQLRGRAGRQGDPGTSLTLVSAEDELVQANAPAHLLGKIRRRGEQLDQLALGRIIDQVQHIAEGIRLDRHRATWDFNRAIARQRATVLAHRDDVMRNDLGYTELTERIPAKLAELTAEADAGTVAALVRDIVLWCLDEQWCDHLSLLSEVRDGIHLRALAGVNPREEFHRIALREFRGFFGTSYERAAAILIRVHADQVGEDVTALGLRRPSATWTYMTSSNPLGSPMDRATRRLGKLLRTNIYKIE